MYNIYFYGNKVEKKESKTGEVPVPPSVLAEAAASVVLTPAKSGCGSRKSSPKLDHKEFSDSFGLSS
jgi:hypothetical protein